MAATLRLDKAVEAAIQTRLRRIEGQIAGLQRMLATGRDCSDITQQVAAARAALDRVAWTSSRPAWNGVSAWSWTERRRPGPLYTS